MTDSRPGRASILRCFGADSAGRSHPQPCLSRDASCRSRGKRRERKRRSVSAAGKVKKIYFCTNVILSSRKLADTREGLALFLPGSRGGPSGSAGGGPSRGGRWCGSGLMALVAPLPGTRPAGDRPARTGLSLPPRLPAPTVKLLPTDCSAALAAGRVCESWKRKTEAWEEEQNMSV